MPKFSMFCVFFLCFLIKMAFSQGLGSGTGGNSILALNLMCRDWIRPLMRQESTFILQSGKNLQVHFVVRVCVVEGRGSYRRAGRFCPILDQENSGVECVLGTDRLDCLRRMGKGTVDFGVFSPEDLIAAQWANLDVLVTNELRHRPNNFEREVVAVINRRIQPDTVSTLEAILRNTTLCHPGLGGDDARGLSDTLSQYLESLVTERSCVTNLSLAENRILSMANFFGKACKAGPWVPDATTDALLKSKYPSLCSACGSRKCDVSDAYWGMSGALNCLVDGAGDVTWVTLRQALAYFGLVPNAWQHFALLCRDGTTQPINSTEPCVWLRRPWASVVAKRKAAAEVSELAYSLTNSSVTVDQHWRGALAALLETNQALTEPLLPQKAPLDYLSRALGFREAYSQSGCSPPRHVTICTTSVIEQHKCDWLSEAGSVYGVDPPLQCVQRENRESCFEAVEKGDCDVTIASSDWLVKAKRDYSVNPILYETTPIVEKLNTVIAYVRKDSSINNMAELRGKRAAFPTFDGLAWHSVTQTLIKEKQISDCGINNVASFFGDSCAPGIETEQNISKGTIEKFMKVCNKNGGNVIRGETEALRSVVEDRSDVAFISIQTYKQYTESLIPEPWAKQLIDIVPICPKDNQKYCLLSWSTLGQIYTQKNITSMRKQEIIFMFKKLDQLFGKYYPFHTAMFSMYGPFNHEIDILFHNNTNILATEEQLRTHPYKRIPLNFERALSDYNFDSCYVNSANMASPLTLLLLISLVFYVIRS